MKLQSLQEYNKLLLEKNKVMNLTAHRTEEDSRLYNIDDSLLFVDFFKEQGQTRLLDIGSGGGCPAIPLAICCGMLSVIALDATRKKVDFLMDVKDKLGLGNFSAVHARVEDYARAHRESFDIVTARAVASLPVLLEYALPLLKVGGILCAYKGKNADSEIEQSGAMLDLLGARVEKVLSADLVEGITRKLVIVRKVKVTPPKYPRKNIARPQSVVKS